MQAFVRFAFMGLIGLVFLAFTGCGHMPVTSMARLAQVDLQTTDPERLRVAVKLPRILKTRDGTVLRIAVKLANGEEEACDFALRTVNERDTLSGEAEEGAELSAFALAPRDVAELRRFRAALMRRQKSGAGGSLTISVRPDACRTEPLPNGPVLFSTYLRTAETSSYVPLARNVDLRRLDPNRDLAALIPACG